MTVVIIVSVVLITIACLIGARFDPKTFPVFLGVIGFAIFGGAFAYIAEECPWMFEKGVDKPAFLLFVGVAAIIVTLMVLFWKGIVIGDKYGPTKASIGDLQDELSVLTRLGDQRALICAQVPDNARDHHTGQPLTLKQLCDYRYCARWLYEEHFIQQGLPVPPYPKL